MKLLVLSLVLSFNVLAASHIGEFAHFNFSQGGLDGTYRVEVKELKDNKYKIEATTQAGGQRSISNDSMNKDELMTHEKMAQILLYCSQIGGENENLKVGSKTFSTCKLPATTAFEIGLIKDAVEENSDAFVWAADVPVMGVVKMTNGEFIMSINSFKWNAK